MVVRDIGGPPSGTSFQISNLIRMSSRYQKINFVPSYPALPYLISAAANFSDLPNWANVEISKIKKFVVVPGDHPAFPFPVFLVARLKFRFLRARS